MDLNVVKGMTFADAQNTFVAKPLEHGKHTVVFKEFDFKKAYIPKGATIEVVPAAVLVDNEEHIRVQNFTVQGAQILARNAGQQIPGLANQSLGGLIAALVKESLKLDMWVVQKSGEDGKVYLNWQFYEPIVVQDSQQNDAVANSLV